MKQIYVKIYGGWCRDRYSMFGACVDLSADDGEMGSGEALESVHVISHGCVENFANSHTDVDPPFSAQPLFDNTVAAPLLSDGVTSSDFGQ